MITEVPARALIAAIRVYQLCLSPLLPPMCRFTPTCSVYALEAVRRFGAVRGALLGLWRVLRCQPFGTPGADPVPETFTLRRPRAPQGSPSR